MYKIQTKNGTVVSEKDTRDEALDMLVRYAKASENVTYVVFDTVKDRFIARIAAQQG